MHRDMDLIKYLPPFLQKYREMILVTDTENPEFQFAHDESERILNNTFILSADADGLARFEKILGLYVAKDDSLETRRSRVMSMWNDISPYTYNALVSKLISLHGSDNFIINRKYDDYEIEIITHLEVPGQVDELDRILDYIMPVNLVVDSKNRIYCNAYGNAYIAGGLAYADMFELDESYHEEFDLVGNYLIGAAHSIASVHELDESYQDEFNIHGHYGIGSQLTNTATVEMTDAYDEEYQINGEADSTVNVGNVQIITTKG